jgi:hypothetical protein
VRPPRGSTRSAPPRSRSATEAEGSCRAVAHVFLPVYVATPASRRGPACAVLSARSPRLMAPPSSRDRSVRRRSANDSPARGGGPGAAGHAAVTWTGPVAARRGLTRSGEHDRTRHEGRVVIAPAVAPPFREPAEPDHAEDDRRPRRSRNSGYVADALAARPRSTGPACPALRRRDLLAVLGVDGHAHGRASAEVLRVGPQHRARDRGRRGLERFALAPRAVRAEFRVAAASSSVMPRISRATAQRCPTHPGAGHDEPCYCAVGPASGRSCSLRAMATDVLHRSWSRSTGSRNKLRARPRSGADLPATGCCSLDAIPRRLRFIEGRRRRRRPARRAVVRGEPTLPRRRIRVRRSGCSG